MCSSCAWAKPAKPAKFEFCENGAKATMWELDRNRAGAEFFAEHPVSDLKGWHDHDLEKSGRLSEPLRYDPDQDRYLPVSWEDAFAEIGKELQGMAPEKAVFYASGHAGLEASYLYALFARAMGHQNLPQSLEHVSRDDQREPADIHRHAGRHLHARGFRPLRHDLLLRTEYRIEQPAVPACTRSGRRAGLPYRDLQSGPRARPYRIRQPAERRSR